MLNLSYTISPKLKELLKKNESVRQKLLLIPLSPQTELKLRWEATINRVYYSLALSGSSMSRRDVIRTLSAASSEKQSKGERGRFEIIQFKKALDYMYQHWTVHTDRVTALIIKRLHQIVSPSKMTVSEKSLTQLTEYLEMQKENPLLQAAIAHAEILKLRPFREGNEKIAILLGLLYLYKFGYTYRGFVSLEQHFLKELAIYKHHCQNLLKEAHITGWLEYYIASLNAQIESVLSAIKTTYVDESGFVIKSDGGGKATTQFFWELNDRQRTILTILEHPFAKVTNRQIQTMFKISQITASRDLAKLTTLGLLFSHGKGRSVYYTKV